MDTNEGITYWDKLRLRALEVERTIKHLEKERQEVHGVKPAVTAAELHRAASLNHEIISVDLDMKVFGLNSGEVGFKDECVQGLIEIYRKGSRYAVDDCSPTDGGSFHRIATGPRWRVEGERRRSLFR